MQCFHVEARSRDDDAISPFVFAIGDQGRILLLHDITHAVEVEAHVCDLQRFAVIDDRALALDCDKGNVMILQTL